MSVSECCMVQGNQGPNALAWGFCLSCSNPLTWFHSRHNTKYLLCHLLQLHVLSLMLLVGYFVSVGLVQVRLGPGVCMYRYICVYICLYVRVYICVCIRWNFVSCYDPLICFHSMLCCTFRTINMLWFCDLTVSWLLRSQSQTSGSVTYVTLQRGKDIITTTKHGKSIIRIYL